jgi:hypothetical protein
MSIYHEIESILRESGNLAGRAGCIASVLSGSFKPDTYEYQLCKELEQLADRHHKNVCKLHRTDLLMVTPNEVEKWKAV